MQEIHSSNPTVVTGICDPNKSQARHHNSLKLDLKLKYRNQKHSKIKKHLPQETLLLNPNVFYVGYLDLIISWLVCELV